MYVCIKIIHILSACAIIGYLIYDICIFSKLKLNRSEQEFKALKREILKPSGLLMGGGFLALILSGSFMASHYLGGESGFAQTTFQKLLLLKILLVASIFLLAVFSLFFILVLKKPDPLRKYYHHIALVLCIGVVIIAKVMFVF